MKLGPPGTDRSESNGPDRSRERVRPDLILAAHLRSNDHHVSPQTPARDGGAAQDSRRTIAGENPIRRSGALELNQRLLHYA
jgi:hypothetical protein